MGIFDKTKKDPITGHTLFEYHILELDVDNLDEVNEKVHQMATSGYRLISVTPMLVRIEQGHGKEKGYNRTISAQYVFERPRENY
jgi:DUF1365 family protein